MFLEYDRTKWEEIYSLPVNTLQMFITDRCDMRCPGCFYQHRLGKREMTLAEYEETIRGYQDRVQKIIILGGEPTLHRSLPQMISFNNSLGLRTTIYTNACRLGRLGQTDLSNTSIRIDVKEYDPNKVFKAHPAFPAILVFMLRRSNAHLLLPFANRIEALGARKMFISGIRDIHETGDYWKDTEDTLPLDEYGQRVNEFMRAYEGSMEIHISRRGTLEGHDGVPHEAEPAHCRFGNIFPNGDKIICPFDISKNLLAKELVFGIRRCTKHDRCLLQKVVLRRK